MAYQENFNNILIIYLVYNFINNLIMNIWENYLENYKQMNNWSGCKREQ